MPNHLAVVLDALRRAHQAMGPEELAQRLNREFGVPLCSAPQMNEYLGELEKSGYIRRLGSNDYIVVRGHWW
jgi:uncharacterized protein YpbB